MKIAHAPATLTQTSLSDTVQLLQGDRNALDRVALATDVAQTMRAALGDERHDPHTTVSADGSLGRGDKPIHNGRGGRKDAIERDAERLFRALDRALLEHHSRPSGLPLMLAALPEHHHLYRKLTHNPFPIDSGPMVAAQAWPHAGSRHG